LGSPSAALRPPSPNLCIRRRSGRDTPRGPSHRPLVSEDPLLDEPPLRNRRKRERNMTTVKLPTAEGSLEVYRLGAPRPFARPSGPLQSRRALAAAHVVADPLADNTPGRPATLDWEATMSFRRHLWSWGLSVADAMDTAQRGMGLDWETTKELVRRSAEAAA